MNFLNKKRIKKIITHVHDFYIVCCKDYDKDLDILSTRNEWNNKTDGKIYKVSIERQIEPDAIRAFDLVIIDQFDKREQDDSIVSRFRLLSGRDQQIFLDDIELPDEDLLEYWLDPKNNEVSEQPETSIFSQYFEQQTGFCSIWPFLSYQGIQGDLWLINVNN